MNTVLTFFLRAMFVLLVAGLIVAAIRFEHDEEAEEREREAVVIPRRVHNGRVVLSSEAMARAGIQTAPARAATWTKQVPLYGRMVPNPKSTVELRAPFAGTVDIGEHGGWPQLGQKVRSGQSLAELQIRVGPQERLDLEAKLKEARLRNQGAVEVEKIQRDRVDRLRSLTTSDIVSRREMADALVALAEAQTQLTTTKAAVELWTTALKHINERKEPISHWRMSLASPGDGEITSVFVRPGVAVEAGSPLVRVVNFSSLLVRLDVPPEVLSGPPPDVVHVEAGERHPSNAPDERDKESYRAGVEARLVGTAPLVDIASQMSSYWYETTAQPSSGQPWRPGLFVTAVVTPDGVKQQPAVAVPAGALVWHEARPWVYVQVNAGEFTRTPVELLGRRHDDFLIGSGVKPGEQVVSHDTQVLLSEEFRIEGDED